MSLTKLTNKSARSCAPAKGYTWCLRDRHGDGRRVHRHFGTEAEGKRTEIALHAEQIGGDPVVRSVRRTFESYAEEWRRAQTWKDPDGGRYSLARAYPTLGATPLTKITGLTLQGLQRELLERFARRTVEQTMHFTKGALRQAHRDGLVSPDPTIGVVMPRKDSLDRDGTVTADEVPTHAEALAIIAGAPSPYRAGVVLGLGCGLRVGEVLGLTPNRVDVKAGTITIDQQWQRRGMVSPKTWRGVRTIEVPGRVLDELRPLVHPWAAPDLPILVGGRGGVLRRDEFYKRAWRPALVGAGLERNRYKFHSARHYAVSAMLAEGVTVVEVAAYVGDTVETITTTYAHLLRGSESKARRALDRALADPLWDKSGTNGAP